MANYENIKEHGFDKMSATRQREIASMGGKAAQKALKKRKAMREIFQNIAALGVTDKTLFKRMQDMGIPDDEITWATALAVSTIMNAIKKNDVKTVALVLQMMEDEIKNKNEFEEYMKCEV